MKRQGQREGVRRKLAAAAVAACFAVEIVYANPVGPVVVNGQVVFNRAGSLLSITNSPGSIINWQQFSIGARETTRFIQQSPASAVLNRVVGGDPSAILGTLQSNGRVFLINPNGILFGSGARIDVGGLVASTLRLSDEDFLAGRMNFLADPALPAAAVVNQGRITASAGGQVFLIGSAVDNQGIITAPSGDIVLAAGNSVRVTESPGSRLQVEIAAPADRSVNLSETLYGARGLYGGLVRNSGTLNANAAVREADGRIVLKASHDVALEETSRITASGAQGGSITVQAEMGTLMGEGAIEATGSQAQGGRIELLGEQVALVNAAAVDASGKTGGGTVLVGGDYQGGNPDVQNAERSYVAREVEIRADAGEKGDGGKVVVWADDTTEFRGAVSARGGARGGDGGFVEVSGKETLVFKGTVDTRAPRGRTGTLLLDPANIIVSTGTNDSPDDGDALTNSFSGAPSGVTGAVVAGDNPAAGTLTLFESELEGIAATTSISLAASNNITINNLTDNVLNLAQTAGNSVTFTAGGTFLMTAGDTIQTAGGAVNVTAGGGATIAGLATAGGAITINVGAASTAGGVIGGAGTSLTKQGAGTLTFNAANTYTGSTTVSAGTLVLGANNQIANGSTVIVDGGTLDINTRTDTVGGVQLLSGSITGTTGVLTSSSAYDVRSGSVSAILGGAVALNKSTTGTVTLSRANTYTGTTTINAGTLRYGANNALAAGAVTVNDGGTYDLNGFSDTIGALTVNSGVTGGAVTTGAGTLTLGGNVTSTGGAANASISGNLGLGAAVRTFTTTNAADGLNISGAISGTGGLTKAGTGTLTLSGTNTYTGVTRINAGVLRAGVLANGGVASAIGASTNAAANLVLAGGTLQYTGPTVSIDRNFTLPAATTSTIDVTDAAATLTIAGASTATTGALTKTGAGTLTLAGANLHTGTTTINAGTLRYGVSNALATGAVIVNDGGTYDLAGFSDSIGALAVNSGATGGTVTTGTGTLTLTGNISSTGAAANASIAGNLVFDAPRTITTSNAADGLQISAAISGAGGLTKAGAGTVTLSGTNTYTGTTTINAGTLRLSGGDAIADTGAVALANVAGAGLELNGASETIGNLSGGGATGGNVALGSNTLTVNQAGATTYSGAISGTGSLVKSGVGNLTLSGTSTYDGTTTISAGTLTATSTAALGSATGGTSVNPGASLALNGTLTWAEPVTLAGGTLARVGGNPILTGAVELSADSVVTGAAGTLTLTGNVNGAGALTKTGAGIVVLSGGNTYTGVTQVNAGTLRVAGGNGIGDASAVIMGGGTLDLAGATETIGSLAGTSNVTLGAGTLIAGGSNASTVYSGVISGTGGLTKQGSGVLAVSGSNSYSGATTVDGGTLQIAGANDRINNVSAVTVAAGAAFDLNGFNEIVGSIAGAGNITLGAGTLTAGNATNTTFSGVISGTGAVTKLGTGTLELSGANTYSGLTTVSAGTLRTSHGSALGSTAVGTTVTAGATLNINNAAIGAETVTLNGTGAGGGGALQGAGTASLAGNVTLNTASTVGVAAGADTLTLSGVVSGAQALTKAGAGTLVLSAANTYTGLTTVNAGTLRYGVNDALAAGAVTVNGGGTYDLAGFSDTIGALAVNSGVTGGSVTTGAGTLTLGGNVTSTGGAANASISGNLALGAATRSFTTTNAADGLTVSAVISGGVGIGLTKAGLGTVTLSGTNTYTGTTTINAGTLRLAGGGAIADAGLVTLTNVASAILDLNGTNETIGSLAGGGTGGGNVTLGSATLLTGGNNGTTAYAGAISGTGGLTKQGTGTMTLSGSNAYTGATTINAGTLTLGAANRIGDASAVTVAGGATFNLAGFAETVGSIAGAGNIALGAGTLSAGGDGSSTTFSGLISGAGALTKQGSGALTLAGTNTYAGVTTVSAGTLVASNTAALGTTAGGTTVSSGATLNISNAAIGSEAISLAGNGAGGAGALTGTDTASLAGTLTLTGASRIGTTSGASMLTLGGAVNAGGNALDITGAGNLTATNPLNNFGTVTANGTGDVTLVDANALTLGASSVGRLSARTLSGDLTLAGNVTATGSGDTIVLAAAANFDNTAGHALTPGGSGRWLIYSTSPAGSIEGGLTGAAGSALPRLYNRNYGANPPASVTEPGNHLIYSAQPALAVAPDDKNKVYGANDPAQTYTAGGFVNDDGVLDTAATAGLIGSFGRAVGEGVGTRLITQGTFTSDAGYSITFDGTRTLTITPAPLSASIADQNKTYGANDPALGGIPVMLTGLVNNPAISTWNGIVSIDDSALTSTATSLARTVGEGVGSHNVTGGSFAAPSANYGAPTLAGTPTLTINPAPLTAAIADQNKTYGANDPALGGIPVMLTGLVNNPAIVTWNGNVSIDDSALTSSVTNLAREVGENVGSHNVTGGTFTAPSANYSAPTLAGTPTLTINPAPLAVTANAQSKTYGAADPVLTFGAAGLVSTTVTDWNGNGTLVNDTTASVLSGALDRAAGETVAGGPYAITSGTLAANGNYSIDTFTGNSLTIVPAPLTIAANDASRAANLPNPPFSATYSGFQLGDTPADLTGTLSFSTPAALGSPAGAYAIAPFGQASSNYVFTYVNGTLTISARPLSTATFVNPVIPAVNSLVPDPQVAASGAPAVVAMDASLSSLPATAAGSEDGAPAEQSAAQPARPVEDTWRCFRSGSIVSRQCR